MTTSRFLCPLDCGWHHDQADPVVDPAFAQLPVPTADLAGSLLAGHLQGVEAVLRAHLETHELREWVKAAAAMRTELDTIEETTVLPLLRETGKLSAELARVRHLHERYRDVEAVGDNDSCAHCNRLTGRRVPWPCPTLQALGGLPTVSPRP